MYMYILCTCTIQYGVVNFCTIHMYELSIFIIGIGWSSRASFFGQVVGRRLGVTYISMYCMYVCNRIALVPVVVVGLLLVCFPCHNYYLLKIQSSNATDDSYEYSTLTGPLNVRP